MIVATVVRIGVLVMMNTHVYAFNGQNYLQTAGGPIGLRSTCAVAQITMNKWDEKWISMMEINNIKVRRNNRLDDIRAMLKSLRMGWR